MTKFLKYFLLIVLPLSFTSCGDDDKDEPKDEQNNIVGKWKCVEDAYGDLWEEPLIYYFDEDGTGYEWFTDEDYSDRIEFSYTATSSKIRINYYEDLEVSNLRYELSNNGNKLIIYGLDENDMSELKFSRID